MGTAAEDVFSAYLYYAVSITSYTKVTSYVKASGLVACILSGVLGDILVTQANSSLNLLMIISAISVCIGFVVGIFTIKEQSKELINSEKLPFDYKIPNHISNRISTIKLFRKQLMLLKYSLSDKYLKMLLMYWIFGNAVYSIVYNYEVSIYIELNNGSDAWNGSVLSIMLIGGTLGALLPSYLETGQFSNQKKSIYLFTAELFCFISLFFSIYCWNLILSTFFLTGFFTAWQFINVITYSHLASTLKECQKEYNTVDITSSHSHLSSNKLENIQTTQSNQSEDNCQTMSSSLLEEDSDPPYSIAVVTIVAVCVSIQIIIQSILFSSLNTDLRYSFWIITYLFIGCTCIHCLYLTFYYFLTTN